MISAASEIEGTKDENGICDITVSCDGFMAEKRVQFFEWNST